MDSILGRAAALALLSMAGLSASTGFAGTLDYDCDTRAEHFSELKTLQTGPKFEIRGVLTALMLTKSKSFGPMASIALSSPDGKQDVRLRVALGSAVSKDTSDEELPVGISTVVDGVRNEEYFAKAPMQQPLRFSIVAEGGQATLTIGGIEKSAKFDPGETAEASVSCSTGEFHFSELEMAG